MEAARESQTTKISRIRVVVRRVLPSCLALAAGLALRLWMLKNFFAVYGDSLIYGGIAKNLLLHGRYALNAGNEIYPTIIRLPGYPFFLAICFRFFGMENYASVAGVQIPLELLGCLLLADSARRIAPPVLQSGVARATIWLAALCPFTAIYAAQPLSETLTLFSITVALWTTICFQSRPSWPSALGFTFAVSFATLLRPDGALVGVALAPALIVKLLATQQKMSALPDRLKPLRMIVVCMLLALAPFAAWSWRNWKVFHLVQPLAPRYANEQGEDIHAGWQRWVKTWCLDFTSTFDVYWNVPGDQLDLGKLPSRAFDSAAEYAETAQLAADYNKSMVISPALDARFARLADERINANPFRYYAWLPLGRLAVMVLRPRVENLPIDLDWWVYAHHNAETCFSYAYAGLNAVYLLLGLAGLWLRPRLCKACWPICCCVALF